MDPRYEDQARLRPSCPKLQTPSNSTVSSFQSSTSSLASFSSSDMSPSSRQAAAAPLPSPSDAQQQPPQYFASFRPQAYMQQQVQPTAYEQSQPPQQFGGGRIEGCNYEPDRAGAGATTQETARYMSEYGLVAEAAKRAEMAVLMRDLGGLDLR